MRNNDHIVDLPLKEAELPAIAAKIVAAKNTPEYEILLQNYEGPGTGVDFDEDTGTFRIADGWGVENGFIVRTGTSV